MRGFRLSRPNRLGEPHHSGITERTAHKVLSDLVDEGYVARKREGRRNRYSVRAKLPLRHPLVGEREVGDLLEVLLPGAASV